MTRPFQNALVVAIKHHVALDENCRGNRCEGAIADDTARRWDEGKERLQNGLGLLQLIEFDERIQESYSNQNAAKIGVLEAVLFIG